MRKFFVVIFCLMMAGCASLTGDDGVFRNRAKDYRGSKLIAALETPPGLSEPIQSDMYAIDESYQQAPIQSISLEPPEFDMGE